MKIKASLVVILLSFGGFTAFSLGVFEHPAKLSGQVLPHPSPASDFTLTDQNNQPFHMADSRGKVALMLFIYTHCTDICPYEAVKVKLAHDLLGSDARNAVFVAVTTDPKRDTPAVCAAYSKALGLSDGWHFVGGAAKDVQAVWFNYGIGVTVNPQTDAVAAKEDTSGADESKGLLKGLTESDVNLVGKIEDAFGGGYDVGHSAPFWFVDKKGMVREIMDGDVTPAQIAKDIRALIAE